jgi:hypothetical protein
MIISAIVFALLLGAFIFLILPRVPLARRTLSVGIFVILIAVIYGGSIELLGRPKPLRLEWRGTADAQVLSAMPVENEAIYVWLVMPGSSEPCAYALPWSLEAAQQLQEAMNQAEADGTAVRMGMPFEASLDDREPMFYAMPSQRCRLRTIRRTRRPSTCSPTRPRERGQAGGAAPPKIRRTRPVVSAADDAKIGPVRLASKRAGHAGSPSRGRVPRHERGLAPKKIRQRDW